MLPILKVFSLTVRVFARPVIYYTKQIHLADKENINIYVKKWFVYLGNHYNRIETKINRKFLKLETKEDFFVKPLKDDQAIEKGVEIFYEVLIYCILLGFPLYEFLLAMKHSAAESRRRDEAIEQMGVQLQDLRINKNQLTFLLQNQINQQTKVNNEIQTLLQDIQQYKQVEERYLKSSGKNLFGLRANEQERYLGLNLGEDYQEKVTQTSETSQNISDQ